MVNDMDCATLERIEAEVRRLTFPEQLWLMERLVISIRAQNMRQQQLIENQLEAMAADPDIQRELRLIEEAHGV